MSTFHSIEEQMKYEKYNDLSERELIIELIDRDNEIDDLKNTVYELQKDKEDIENE
jgi:hypothetical protein